MNYIIIANTTPPMADYYGLGVTLIALILIIFGIRGIIRGRPPRQRKKEIDS